MKEKLKEKLTSIVVPTYKEAENIQPLAEQIDSSMKNAKLAYEIIIVDDDSDDGIIDIVHNLEKKYNIRIKVRKNEKGLASAVIEGIRISNGEIITVMDADLSHPPKKIPEIVQEITKENADFVVGSRFVKGGSMSHFNFYRRLNAWISKTLARPLTKINDPMAGFFAFPKNILKPEIKLNPLGFKIGLELLVKTEPKKVLEIPIEFKERLHGESKLSLKEQVYYLFHLKRLFEFKYSTLSEFIKFSLIGTFGMIIDLSLVRISMEIVQSNNLITEPWDFRISRLIGFIFALTSNFFLNRKFTFEKAKDSKAINQYLKFFIISILGFTINWFISIYLRENTVFFYTHYLVASFLGILGGLFINFSGSKFIVFKSDKKNS